MSVELESFTLASLHIRLTELERENARLQMELDASCNAEELRQVRAENAALRADKERLIIILQHLVNTAKRAMREAGRDGAEWDIKDELSEAYAAIDAARKAKP